jgi:hypothetical protein
VEWVTNGYVAIVGPVPAGVETVSEVEALADMITNAAPKPVKIKCGRGLAVAGEMVAQGYFVDLAEAAYPGIQWHASPIGELGALVGRKDGAAVAIVMPIRAEARDRGNPPPCATCEGIGGPPCKECDGGGKVDHGCDCEYCERDEDCETCDGKGFTEKCPTCGGSGHWKPEHDAVSP